MQQRINAYRNRSKIICFGLKKLISILILLNMVFVHSAGSLALASEGYQESVLYENELEFLKSISVFPNQFEIFRNISRGEFVDIVSKLMFKVTSESNAVAFRDVKEDYKFFQQISMLQSYNIINGDKFSNFYPYKDIKFIDAVTILVNALGYKPYTVKNGGYPLGYLHIASQIGLLHSLDKSEYVNGNTLVKLIYNALFVNCVEADTITNQQTQLKINRKQNILEQNLDIIEYDAVVIYDGISSLDNGLANSNKISVRLFDNGDEMSFSYKNRNVCNYLGNRLRLFVKHNDTTDEDEILYFEKQRKQDSILLSSNQITDVDNNYIEYDQNNHLDKSKKLYFSSSSYVFVNGIKKADYTKADLMPKDGFVEWIDNNADRVADFIKVTRFDYNIVVDKVSLQDQRVFCSQNPMNNLNLSDNAQYRIIKNDTLISLDDIKEMNIISVAESDTMVSDNKLYFLYVCDKVISGNLISSDEPNNEIRIYDADKKQETVYSIAHLYLQTDEFLFRNLPYNNTLTFCLTAEGKIAYMDTQTSKSQKYYYIIDLVEQSSIRGLEIKVYSTSSGQFEIYTLSSKVSIDGKTLDRKLISNASANAFTEARELLSLRANSEILYPTAALATLYNKTHTTIYPRLALIKIGSNNEVISIDTDTPNDSNKEAELSDANILREGPRIYRNRKFNLNSSTFDGRFFVTKETKVIKVPDVDRYNIPSNYSFTLINYFEKNLNDLNNYAVLPSTMLDPNITYDAQAYNVNPDTGVADILLVRGSNIEQNDNVVGNFVIFKKVITCYDEEKDKVSYKMIYSDYGVEKSLIIDKDDLNPYYTNIVFGGKYPSSISINAVDDEIVKYVDVEPLQYGDIIYVGASGKYLTHVSRELNLSLVNQKMVSTYKATAYIDPYLKTAYTTYNVAVPYDHRVLVVDGSYNPSYNMELGIAVKLYKNALMIKQPYSDASGTKMGTLGDYIANPDATFIIDKYLNINPTTTKLIVIEEKKCDIQNDSCSYEIKNGNLTDLRFKDSFGDDGLIKASRIYAYSVRGVVKELVIINFCDQHNIQTK